MAGYPNGQPNLCWLGRAMQKVGCLPNRQSTSTQFYYPIDIRPVNSGFSYSDDIKYKPGPRLPPPQPDEPRPRMTSMVTYQHRSPRVPKSPKKTPVAQTVPLSTLPLPVNTLPVYTPVGTCVTVNVDLPPVHPTAQRNHTPYSAPLSAIPYTPRQNTVPDSVIQDLGNLVPTQYVWNTPHGALTYTPAPASHLHLPNPLADLNPCSPCVVNAGGGNDGSMGLGLILSPISSDSSDSSSNSSSSSSPGFSRSQLQSDITLNPLLESDRLSSTGTPIEWNVSDHPDMAWHTFDNVGFLASAGTPATDPRTNTLRIDLCFVDQPGVQWNWEPIVMRKRGTIRITDVLHAIYNYFQLQLTHPEFDIIKSYGKRNERIVVKSWRERAAQSGEAQSLILNSGLRRVDCLGSSKNFAGLWVDGSRLKLGLRA